MKVLKTIGDIALVFLAIIGTLVTATFIYYNIFVHEETLGVNNIGDQLAVDVVKSDDLTEEQKSEYEERWFMEANYFSNDKNNGIELQELKFNYFMSPNLTQADYRATGMQATKFAEVESVDGYTASIVEPTVIMSVGGFSLYDTTNGINWSGYMSKDMGSVGTVLNRDENLIIKIDNRAFSIQLTGGYESGWWIFSTFNEYDYIDVMNCVMQAIRTNSAGYGDYYITLDLSQFFSIKEYTEDGKFKEDNVTDIIKNYAVLKFHYDENGAIRSSQSLFGKIECNSVYDYNGVDFWSGRMVYTLTEEDVEYRYSAGYNGNFISISQEKKDLFKNMPKVKLIIDLDLTDKNVIGFDYLAFSDLKIDTLRITGADSIRVMNNAFEGATLKMLLCADSLTFEGEFGIEYERGGYIV